MCWSRALKPPLASLSCPSNGGSRLRGLSLAFVLVVSMTVVVMVWRRDVVVSQQSQGPGDLLSITGVKRLWKKKIFVVWAHPQQITWHVVDFSPLWRLTDSPTTTTTIATTTVSTTHQHFKHQPVNMLKWRWQQQQQGARDTIHLEPQVFFI